jgi:hypothetical protein
LVATLECMAARKKTRTTDRHLKTKSVRLRPQFIPLVERLANLEASDSTKVVNDAVRAALGKAGLWPPRSGSGSTMADS